MKDILLLKNLTKYYNKNKIALDNISLNIKKGEKIGVIGLNGAGKSTLMRLIVGSIKPSYGEIYFEGKMIDKLERFEKQRIGYLSTHNNLYAEFTVKENLEVFKRLYQATQEQKIKVIDYFSLGDILDTRVEKLSSGMKQKTAIACITMNDPQLLILDEPTITLDVEIKKLVIEYIKHISQDSAMLISSHNLSDIENLCDRIYILSKGKIIREGTVEEILQEAYTSQGKCKICIEPTLDEVIKRYISQYQVEYLENQIMIVINYNQMNTALKELTNLGASIISAKNSIDNLEDAVFKLLS